MERCNLPIITTTRCWKAGLCCKN